MNVVSSAHAVPSNYSNRNLMADNETTEFEVDSRRDENVGRARNVNTLSRLRLFFPRKRALDCGSRESLSHSSNVLSHNVHQATELQVSLIDERLS